MDFSTLKTPEKSIEDFKAAVLAQTFEELELDERNAIGYATETETLLIINIPPLPKRYTLKCVGSGFVALRYNSFEEALMYVAREAGDSDTNGTSRQNISSPSPNIDLRCRVWSFAWCQTGKRFLPTKGKPRPKSDGFSPFFCFFFCRDSRTSRMNGLKIWCTKNGWPQRWKHCVVCSAWALMPTNKSPLSRCNFDLSLFFVARVW